jgi:hypothetical protein
LHDPKMSIRPCITLCAGFSVFAVILLTFWGVCLRHAVLNFGKLPSSDAAATCFGAASMYAVTAVGCIVHLCTAGTNSQSGMLSSSCYPRCVPLCLCLCSMPQIENFWRRLNGPWRSAVLVCANPDENWLSDFNIPSTDSATLCWKTDWSDWGN